MKFLKKVIDYIETAPVLYLLISIIILQTALHFKFMDYPPIGTHQWRQTHTLSVARNFYDEGMDIFHPRIDSRGATPGITGMEFPIVNYIIAVGYNIFGFSNIVFRTVMLIFGCWALAGCFLFIKQLLKSQWLGFAGTLFLLFSPLFFYYSITSLPDVPSLGFIFWSLYFFLRFRDTGKTSHFVYTLIMLVIAVLIKLYALVLLPLYVFEMWKTENKNISRSALLFYLGLSLVIILNWYLYAIYLSYRYQIFDFLWGKNFPYPFFETLFAVIKVSIKWFPKHYMNSVVFIFFCFGCFRIIKKENGILKKFLWLYGLGLLLYLGYFMAKFPIHDYYAIYFLPLFIVIAVVGFKWLAGRMEAAKWLRCIMLILLIALPFLGYVFSTPHFNEAGRSDELLTLEKYLDEVIPDKNNLIIAAGDSTVCVYLYFMRRKGWTVDEELSECKLVSMKNSGAKYFVSSSRLLESQAEIQKHISFISQYGRFKVFAIQ